MTANPSSSSDTASPGQSAIVPIDAAATFAIEISLAGRDPVRVSGTTKSVIASLSGSVRSGSVAGDAECLLQSKSQDGKWVEQRLPVRDMKQLEFLYRPAKHFFKRAILTGFLAGIIWESFFQGWQLYQHYDSLAPVVLFWLPGAFIAGIAIDDVTGGNIAKFLFPGIIMAIFMGRGGTMLTSVDHIAEALTPTFSALVVSLAVGSMLGITLIGGVIGIWPFLMNRMPTAAPDSIRESVTVYRLATISLLILAAPVVVFYLNSARHWPLAAEMYMRQDLKDHPIH